MKATYNVKGLNKFIRSVKHKPAEVKRAVDRELNLSALRVERKAKINAPWDTGWMSNNIYSIKVGDLSWQIISPVYYSIYVELGTRNMAAQPFMYPALEEEYWVLMRRLNRIVKG